MNNLILEMKKITEEGKDNHLPNLAIRTQLKEFLHYFVLDFIYNSKFKNLIFYGGSCARIIYDLDRMSEDLDFEADKNTDFNELAEELKKHFSEDLKLNDKFSIKEEKGINRIFLKFPIMRELGLSQNESESLNIKVEIRAEDEEHFKNLKPIFTAKNMYGKSFMVKHYDMPTLFASKLAAILDRPQKGFSAGKNEDGVNYKGRDFYDLIWYMGQRILPNEEMLRVNEIKNSIGDIFDEISIFIAKNDFKKGLKRDLEHLFPTQAFVESFIMAFRDTFDRLKKERYMPKKIKELEEIFIDMEFKNRNYFIEFSYSCENGSIVRFQFTLTYFFVKFGKEIEIDNILDSNVNKKIIFTNTADEIKIKIKKYIPIFLNKIDDYLKRHDNEVYFDVWESKTIRVTEDKFNPEKEIIFHSGEELATNKKIKLEDLQM